MNTKFINLIVIISILNCLFVTNIYADFTLPNTDGNLTQIMVMGESNTLEWNDDNGLNSLGELNMLAELGFLAFIMIGLYFVTYKKGYHLIAIIGWLALSMLSLIILENDVRMIGFIGIFICFLLIIIWFKEKGLQAMKQNNKDIMRM
jgi:hypothetical protein